MTFSNTVNLSQVLDSVLSRIVMCSERPSVASGLHLLDLCLALEPSDPLILSTLLSCISALFVFLSMSPAETSTVSIVLNFNSYKLVLFLDSEHQLNVLFGLTTYSLKQAYLPRVLDKIFATLVFTLPGETKDCRSRAVKNVRRHAASLMVKIGQKYPLLLLPVFDRIHSIVTNLESKRSTLSKMESVCLQVRHILAI